MSMRIVALLMVASFFCLSTSACGSVKIATPRNWQESDWPAHGYEEVADITRSILVQKFKYTPTKWEHDKDDKLILFQTLWNASGAENAVFSGMGKRRKVWVEVEEVALDVRYDPAAKEKEGGTANEASKMRIELRDGVYKRIVTRVAIACAREKNNSTVFAGDPARGDWGDDGADDDQVAQIMGEIAMRLKETQKLKFDVSDKASDIYLRYFREEQLTPEEKARINERRTNKFKEDVRKAREERE